MSKQFQITGDSMHPLYKDGEVIEVEEIKKNTILNIDDIVVARHPYRKIKIIKKVTEINGDKIELSGINDSESEDSRGFGRIDRDKIIYRVVN